MGGIELPSIVGHLGGREPIVKPAFQGRFRIFKELKILKASGIEHANYQAPSQLAKEP